MFVDEPVADLMNVIVAVVHLGVLVEEQEPEQANERRGQNVCGNPEKAYKEFCGFLYLFSRYIEYMLLVFFQHNYLNSKKERLFTKDATMKKKRKIR